MQKALGELISFQNATGFNHDGILFRGDNCDTTIVHIHGSFGNFYQQKFVRVFAKIYANKINLISFNLTCHDGLADSNFSNDDTGYTGGSIADFSTCLADIQAAIDFVKPFSRKIILQGHSLGCDRVIHYLLNKREKYDFILLSPCDSYQLQCNYIAPKNIESQILRLKKDFRSDIDYDWLPTSEYGIRQGSYSYPNPITRKALISILEGPPFSLFRISKPAKFWLDQKCLIYIGGKDKLQTSSSDVMFKYFEERVGSVTRVPHPEGDHGLARCEPEVAHQIINWLATHPPIN
jgi:hypothetical protein